MTGTAFFKGGGEVLAMVRPGCSDCGSLDLRRSQLVDLLPFLGDELRPHLAGLVRLVGLRAPAWLCSCGAFGVVA